jgi:hypothetical protein
MAGLTRPFRWAEKLNLPDDRITLLRRKKPERAVVFLALCLTQRGHDVCDPLHEQVAAAYP